MTQAFLFSGQGSQSVGMMRALGERYDVVRATFDQASQVLGDDLWHLVDQGPEEQLNQTVWTQPAMLAAGVATYRVWREQGGDVPTAMAGHSLGEYSALVCADALSFTDATALVARRAQLMQDAVAPGAGAMVAVIGLSDEQVSESCTKAAQGEVVEAVNFNAPGQVVVAGDASAVARLIDQANADGAKRVIPLPVSVPSHCALMRPAGDAYEEALAKVAVSTPTVRILFNAGPVDPADPNSMRAAMARQIYSPVPWRSTIETLLAEGTERFYECSPGRVLSGLVKRIHRRAKMISLHDADAMDAALAATELENGEQQ
ncbi:MAG: ACP S-malonyltransferase [Gammaproteobacteria bacterium]